METPAVLPPLLDWSRRLQAIAQTGLTYASDPYDVERYHAIRRLAAEMAAGREGAAVEDAVELFARDSGYATPKVDMRAVVFRTDGRLLLVRERSDGGWTLPGGWADMGGGTPAENVEREVREESGFEVRAVKLLAVYDRDRHPHPPMREHVYKLFMRCELVGGEAAGETSETTDAGFFAEDEFPAPLSTARVTASQLVRFFEHYRQPDLPTDFD